MESVLIRKKIFVLFLIIFILISAFLFSGCDPKSGQYPFQKEECWYSEEPIMTLQYTKNDDDTWIFSEKLIWEGNTKEISIGMQGSYYCVYPADSNDYEDRLFCGRWKYREGNLVLIIEEDFIFGGAYSEIVLAPGARD